MGRRSCSESSSDAQRSPRHSRSGRSGPSRHSQQRGYRSNSYDQRGRHNDRRNVTRDRSDSRDRRNVKRDRSDSRDRRYSKRDRSDSRDRRYSKRDRSDSRARRYSKRDRSDSRDRRYSKRDRSDSRGRRDNDKRYRPRSSSRGGRSSSQIKSVSKIDSCDELMRFDEWAREQRRERLGASDALYRVYVNQFRHRREMQFVDKHKENEWFLSRYNPVVRQSKRQEHILASRDLVKRFFADVEKDWPAVRSIYFPDLTGSFRFGERRTETVTVGELFHPSSSVSVDRIPANMTLENLHLAIKTLFKSENLPKDILVDETGSASKEFERTGWIVCKSDADAASVLKRSNGKLDDVITLGTTNPRTNISVNRQFLEVSNPFRVKRDLAQARSLAQALDKDINENCGIVALLSHPTLVADAAAYSPEDNEVFIGSKEALGDYFKDRYFLDIVLGYLRNVHYICVYSKCRKTSLAGLLKESFVPYIRPRLSEEETNEFLAAIQGSSYSDWISKYKPSAYAKSVDEFIKMCFPVVENQELKDFESSKSKAEGTFLAMSIQEDEGKYLCSLPPYSVFDTRDKAVQHIKEDHVDCLVFVAKQAELIFAAKQFENDKDQPLPALPSFAVHSSNQKSSGALVLANEANTLHPHLQVGAFGSVTAQNVSRPVRKAPMPGKVRTVIDYSLLS